MRFTRWAAVPFAFVYLILMAHRLEGAIVSTNLDADAASAPVIIGRISNSSSVGSTGG